MHTCTHARTHTTGKGPACGTLGERTKGPAPLPHYVTRQKLHPTIPICSILLSASYQVNKAQGKDTVLVLGDKSHKIGRTVWRGWEQGQGTHCRRSSWWLPLTGLTELSEEAAEMCVGQDRGVWARVEVCGRGHVYCVNVISFTQRKQCVLSHLISGSSTILACFPHCLLFAELTATSGPLLQLCAPHTPSPAPE